MTILYLCGAGNSEGVRLALLCNQRDRRFEHLVLLDDDRAKHGKHLLGVPIRGPLDALAEAPAGSAAANLVARTTRTRAAVHQRLLASGVPLANLVHPSVDAADCQIGQGVLVYEHAVLSPETRLGDGCCVFMRAVVGHEASAGRNCVLAAGAVLNARVALGDRVYVGSNASVLPEVRIADDVTVGANSMVASDVPANATVLGVPGQVLAAPMPPSPPAAARDAPPAAAETAVAELAAELLQVLHRVLGSPRARATDRFFDVGGSSLRAVQFLELLRSQLGHAVPLPVFYARCTMLELARHLCGSTPVASAAAAAQQRARQRVVPRQRGLD